MATVTAIALLRQGSVLDAIWRLNPDAKRAFGLPGRWAGAALLALGLATLCAAVGLIRGRAWAWWIAFVLFLVNGTGDLLSIFLAPHAWKGVAGVVVAGVFLYVLTRPQTKMFAGTAKRPPAGDRLI